MVSTDSLEDASTLSTPVAPRESVKAAPSSACALLITTLSAAASPPRTSSEMPSGASMRTVARAASALRSQDVHSKGNNDGLLSRANCDCLATNNMS